MGHFLSPALTLIAVPSFRKGQCLGGLLFFHSLAPSCVGLLGSSIDHDDVSTGPGGNERERLCRSPSTTCVESHRLGLLKTLQTIDERCGGGRLSQPQF